MVMTIKLPPPPPGLDFKSPAVQDWLYKLVSLVNVQSPDANVILQEVFGRRPVVQHLEQNAVDGQTLLPGQSFAAKPVPFRPEINSVNSLSILAGQIFGS
jgi:hypothetical protein